MHQALLQTINNWTESVGVDTVNKTDLVPSINVPELKYKWKNSEAYRGYCGNSLQSSGHKFLYFIQHEVGSSAALGRHIRDKYSFISNQLASHAFKVGLIEDKICCEYIFNQQWTKPT
ncbi:unnamed protein product [Ceratitis capitata]|uniref:(Mediterranean fruit fly) hypothetical protein n=1 Tax=Ceratitis capitata TaxID=7213 RepID=A0A811UVI0_CERCA|nr:unnamed protein product [Ceratitis capitata]